MSSCMALPPILCSPDLAAQRNAPPPRTCELRMIHRIRLLNVDLDISSDSDLRPLARALENSGAFTLHCGRCKTRKKFIARFELDVPGRTMEATLRRFVKVIRVLPPAARRVWDEATERELNAGFQSAHQPRYLQTSVGPRTMQALVDLNARLGITIYAPRVLEPVSSTNSQANSG